MEEAGKPYSLSEHEGWRVRLLLTLDRLRKSQGWHSAVSGSISRQGHCLLTVNAQAPPVSHLSGNVSPNPTATSPVGQA